METNTFTTRSLETILRRADFPLDPGLLKLWINRGIIPLDRVGRGTSREYSLADLVLVACFVCVRRRRVEYMRGEGELREAYKLAKRLADPVLSILQSNPDTMGPCYVLVTSVNGLLDFEELKSEKLGTIRSIYGTRGALLVDPYMMAAHLRIAIREVTAKPTERRLRTSGRKGK